MIVWCGMCTVNLADRYEYSGKTIGPSYRSSFGHACVAGVSKYSQLPVLAELLIISHFFLLRQNTARSVSVDLKIKLDFFLTTVSLSPQFVARRFLTFGRTLSKKGMLLHFKRNCFDPMWQSGEILRLIDSTSRYLPEFS